VESSALSAQVSHEGLILNRKAVLLIILFFGLVTARPTLLGHREDVWAHEGALATNAGAVRAGANSAQAESAGALSQFLPHGVCLLWDQSLLLLHVISDSIIALAYYSIPVALIFFVRKRKDLAFSWIFVLFAIFIVACGTTHVLGIWMIWRPAYWLDGIVKALTAAVSLVTAILLWPLIPKALALPSPNQLRSAYKALEEQNRAVERANRMKSEFLANMSHELRTPLNGIIGFTELMHDGKLGPVSVRHREYLGDVLTSAKHLLDLINDILDLSKVETGKIEFRPAPVKLSKIVGEVRDVVRAIAARKQITIHLDLDTRIEDLVIDPGKLKQVLYNYLSNALKFTSDGGAVVVRTATVDGDRFRIEVEDNGIGIPADDMSRLFVEFQQLDSSSTKKYPGTGLGLALTKKIVEAQGGEVGVRSMPGRGSVFFAVLPRVYRRLDEIKENNALAAPWTANPAPREL
jgi:signal transduction histidine kinase